jgi:hypothetical protein
VWAPAVREPASTRVPPVKSRAQPLTINVPARSGVVTITRDIERVVREREHSGWCWSTPCTSPPASSSTTTYDYGVWLERRHHLAPKRSALDFLPCNVQARQRTMAVGSPIVLVRRARAQGQPVRKLLAADVLEKNQQLSSAFSSNPFAGA